MLSVRYLLLAVGAVGLREAGEAGESTSNSIVETKSNADAKVTSLNTALWQGVQEFGDLKAFLVLVTLQSPPDNLDELHKEHTEIATQIHKDSIGTFLFHGFKSEAHPDKCTIAMVVSDKVAFEHLMKLQVYQKWMKILNDLSTNILRVKFIGDPQFSPELGSKIFGRTDKSDWPIETWNQTSGFARGPVKEKVHGKTFIIEGVFQVPNDNLPTINVLNTAYMASQFDWDPTCFFARICLDPSHEGDETMFTYGGVYMMGFRPWSRAIEFGEGKSETNWVATAAQYGVGLLQQNIYGADSPKFKDKVKKLGANLTTFWDFAYGFDRYKTERYLD